MTCDDIRARMDDYLDGQLPPAERAAVAAHLAGCATCRQEADALDGLLREARTLPRSLTPPRELWTGIEQRLAPAPAAFRRPRGLPAWAGLAAGLALMLLGAALATLWLQRGGGSFAEARARYTAATAELAQQLSDRPGTLSPDTRAVVERNLRIVDQAIGEAEAALTADQGNPALEQMLLARYEQRLGLLRRAGGAATGARES